MMTVAKKPIAFIPRGPFQRYVVEEFANVRKELRGEIHAESKSLRNELRKKFHGEINGLRKEFRETIQEFQVENNQQFRNIGALIENLSTDMRTMIGELMVDMAFVKEELKNKADIGHTH